jgi:glycosyltransferase involved in cell wall biosynthesis
MALFFSNCDIHVLPSINNTETFGLVQVEAALCGTPSVASALPGVRMPTRMTKMGLSVPPADPQALAQGICTVLDNPALYHQPRGPIAQLFAPDTTAAAYETIFNDMLHKK